MVRAPAKLLLVLAAFAAACGGLETDDSQDDELGCAAGQYEFLNDACHRKAFPSNRERTLSCPVLASVAAPGYAAADVAPRVDETALRALVPSTLRVTLVLIQRVNGVPLYRYLSNGTSQVAYQPWSSTKFMAAANAGANLRRLSNGAVGLSARTASGLPLGDAITNIETYDTSHGYTSNGLAKWFHDIGGRARANALIHDGWLRRPATETFGGNYGSPAPALGYSFTAPGGAKVAVTADTTSGPANHLSTFTSAEFLKRLAVSADEPRTRLPYLADEDLAVLFYGASPSRNYPRAAFGGMSADQAIYLQSAVDLKAVEQKSAGRWRIFSKLGGGNGEFVNDAYGCFPVLDAAGAPVPDAGREFVLAVELPTGGSTWAQRDALLAKSVKAIVSKVMDGTLR